MLIASVIIAVIIILSYAFALAYQKIKSSKLEGGFWSSFIFVVIFYVFIILVGFGFTVPDKKTQTLFKTKEILKSENVVFVYKDGFYLMSKYAADVNTWDSNTVFYLETSYNMYGVEVNKEIIKK